jgi:hypothetical protein
MDKKKSVSTNTSSGSEKVREASETSEYVKRRRRANTRIVQNVLLIWLDNRIDENGNNESRDTITSL